MAPATPVLEATGIVKDFLGVRALKEVDFRLFPGEVHALMGENGAGKSTLIKVLTGVHAADGGEIRLQGTPVRFTGPLHARAHGVSTVYQEVNLCPSLSIAENVLLGREPRRFGAIRWKELRRRATELLARLDIDVDVRVELGSQPLAVQQMVAIARAIDVDARVLILDEPTSSLDREEVDRLFAVLDRLRGDGVAVLFVSHFLEQIYEISDRVTVLRDGGLIGEYATAELPRRDLVARMLGQEPGDLEAEQHRTSRAQDDQNDQAPFVTARGVGRKGAIAPFDLDLTPGRVTGLAGLLGSGRSESARLLAGADRADQGQLTVDGAPVTLRGPRAAIARSIAYLSENRKADGLIPDLTVTENIVLALQAAQGWARPLSARRTDELVTRWMTALDIRPRDPSLPVRNLSGGNQQKVLLARWLLTEPRLLILDEPTRGIDIGAKAQILRLISGLADDGLAVLFVSAELEEVLRLSDTVAVLRDRELVAALPGGAALTVERLMEVIATGENATGEIAPGEVTTGEPV
ncbi:sugar ABC transporter ATP-binding protein [Streptomyces apocyni]|uniref:sugar ABC transporter ATP-binding protein n=1 Tax=Streptomyces apocyni TaxID=2654677 RepID=UPI0012EA4C47|nr:sugar ABC transporter ATP-binding protein [Streptomyces apocyni]